MKSATRKLAVAITNALLTSYSGEKATRIELLTTKGVSLGTRVRANVVETVRRALVVKGEL